MASFGLQWLVMRERHNTEKSLRRPSVRARRSTTSLKHPEFCCQFCCQQQKLPQERAMG